jgi:hypothetical protein
VKVKVVSEDVGVKVNNAKTWVAWEYSLACLRPKLRKKCLWVKGSRWGKCITDLPPKFGPTNFLDYLLESAWIELTFPYAMLPCHKGAKQGTIGVIWIASAKLPHHRCLAPSKTMENETSFVHHT